MFAAQLLRFCILQWTLNIWHWFSPNLNFAWDGKIFELVMHRRLVLEAVFFFLVLHCETAVNHRTVLQSSASCELQESTDPYTLLNCTCHGTHWIWYIVNQGPPMNSSEPGFFLGGGGVGVVCHRWGLLTINQYIAWHYYSSIACATSVVDCMSHACSFYIWVDTTRNWIM